MKQVEKFKKYRLSYIFEAAENSLSLIPSLKIKQKIGKFTFLPSTKGSKGFNVSVLVKAKDIDDAKKDETAVELADIISLFDVYGLHAVLTSGEQTSWEIKNRKKTKQVFQQFRIKADLLKEIEPEVLEKSVGFFKKLNRFSSKKRKIIKHSVHYYARGKRDRDQFDAFIDFWSSLEILTALYSGKISPARCSNCNHVYDPRPIGGTLRALLRKLKLKDHLETLNELYDERGKIIHPHSKVKSPSTVKLQDLVRKVLEKIVLTS